MKTQKLNSIIIAIIIAIFVLPIGNAFANTNEMYLKIDSVEVEKSVEIESWMYSDEYWRIAPEQPVANTVVKENKCIEIEPWMFDDQLWRFDTVNISKQSSSVFSGKLEIEPWMIDDKVWRM